MEIFRICEYKKNDYRLSYLRTKDDAEIDLIIERPGPPDLLLEIKSSETIREDHLKTLERFSKDWKRPCEAMLWSQDTLEKKIGRVSCLHWKVGFEKVFCNL